MDAVDSYDVGGVFFLVPEGYFYVLGVVDYVVVSEDVTIGADNNSGSEATLAMRAGRCLETSSAVMSAAVAAAAIAAATEPASAKELLEQVGIIIALTATRKTRRGLNDPRSGNLNDGRHRNFGRRGHS